MSDQAVRLRQIAAQKRTEASVLEEDARPSSVSQAVASRPARREGARVIAVTSGKGGVGKTVIAANLGLHYAMTGQKVLMLDADFGLANMDVVLGLSAKRNISDVITGEATLSEIILEGPDGLRVIPAGSGIRALANLSQSHVMGLLDEMFGFDSVVDMFIIDTAAGIASGVSGVLLSADEVIVVTQPEPTAVLDAYAVVKTLVADRPDARIYVVANCVVNEEQGQTVFRNLQSVADRFLGKQLLFAGSIPMDPRLVDAVKMRKPGLKAFPNSAFSTAIRQLAREIGDLEDREKKPRSGIYGFFGRMLRGVSSKHDG